jgi:hypothetical protein
MTGGREGRRSTRLQEVGPVGRTGPARTIPALIPAGNDYRLDLPIEENIARSVPSWPVLFQPIHERQDLRHRLVELGWYLPVDIDLRQEFHEDRVLLQGDAVFIGDGDDLLGEGSGAFGKDSGGPVLSCVVAEGNGPASSILLTH